MGMKSSSVGSTLASLPFATRKNDRGSEDGHLHSTKKIFVCVCVRASVYPSVCVCLSVCLSVCLPTCLPASSVSVSRRVPIYLSIYLSIHQSIHPSHYTYQSVSLPLPSLPPIPAAFPCVRFPHTPACLAIRTFDKKKGCLHTPPSPLLRSHSPTQ